MVVSTARFQGGGAFCNPLMKLRPPAGVVTPTLRTMHYMTKDYLLYAGGSLTFLSFPPELSFLPRPCSFLARPIMHLFLAP